VIGKTFFRGESGQSNIDNWFLWIASRICQENFANPGGCGIQQYYVHIVMIAAGSLR
jgi:hypothetical protein